MPVEPRAKPSQRTRYRYVLFRILRPAHVTRGAFVDALRRAASGTNAAWLTRFDGAHGILRVGRGSELDRLRPLREGLAAAGVDIETLATSGTIAALLRSHPRIRLPASDR